MPAIPALEYPSFNDLGSAVEQRITGSVDHKKAGTACTRLAYFFKFIEHYDKWDVYLSNDRRVVNTIIGRYAVFMLSGFNITNIEIKVGTIRGYLSAVNDHYEAHGYEKPYVKGDKSDADKLLSEQKKIEGASEKRSSLNDKIIVNMQELAQGNVLGFKATAIEFTALGRFGGFRQHEFCMDSKTSIKYYVLPNGTTVVRVYTGRNFIFFDEDACKVVCPLQ